MATRSRQIGWSSESNMLYNILREIKALQGLAANISTTTTSTTLNPNPSVKVNPPSVNTFNIPAYNSGTDDGDFCVEWLQYMYTDTDFPRTYSIGQYPAQNAISIEGGVLYLWLNGGMQGSYPLSSLPGGGYLNTWLHITVYRYKSDISVWVSSYVGNYSSSIIQLSYTNAIPTNGLDFYIGSENADATYYNGLISNFRFTIGSSVYVGGDPGFPLSPLSLGANTKLLMGKGVDLTNQTTDQTGINTITVSNVTYNGNSGIPGDFNGSLQFGTV